MKRLTVGSVIFLVLLAIVQLPSLLAAYRSISPERATGVAFVLGSPTEILFRVLVLVILIALAYWLSGKLVRQ